MQVHVRWVVINLIRDLGDFCTDDVKGERFKADLNKAAIFGSYHQIVINQRPLSLAHTLAEPIQTISFIHHCKDLLASIAEDASIR